MARLKPVFRDFSCLFLVTIAIYVIAAHVVPDRSSARARSYGPGRTFTVEDVRGSAVAYDRSVERFVPLQKGMKIRACDLRTGPSGAMTLKDDGLTLTLSHGARTIVGDGKKEPGFRLMAGHARLRLKGGTAVSVRSPHGTFRAEGGAFRLQVDTTGTEVLSEAGAVEITSPGPKAVVAEGSRRRVGTTPVSLPAFPASLTDVAGTGGTLTVPNREGGETTQLRVEELEVQVIIDGRIALTRIDQIFANDTNRRCEGKYVFVLPSGATLSRYAMYTSETRLVEGEIVDRQRARQVYTEIVRRMQDPALVEWQQGNLFTARIFPIEPRSRKRVLLSYTQVLPRRYGRCAYSFPLVSGLTKENPVGKLAISLRFAGNDLPGDAVIPEIPGLTPGAILASPEDGWRVEGKGVSPGGDFRLLLDYLPLKEPRIFCHKQPGDDKGFFLLALPPEEGTNPEEADPVDLAVFVDTSLSRAGLTGKLQVRAVEYILSQLQPQDRFRLWSHDASVRSVGPEAFVNAAPASRSAAMSALASILPLGGSDQGLALASMAGLLSKGSEGRRLVALWITDGMASLGRRDVSAMTAPLGAVDDPAGTPIHVLALGNPVNRNLLRAVTCRTGGLLLEAASADAFDRSLLDLAVAISGGGGGGRTATRLVPTVPGSGGRPPLTVAGDPFAEILPPGTERLVLGRYDPATDVTIERGRERAVLSLPGEERANSFIPRLWAQRRMEALLEREADPEIVAELVSLSQRFTLICPYTTFLVLETEKDYKRWGIDRAKRRAYWKPWLVEPKPLGVQAPLPPPAKPAPPKPESKPAADPAKGRPTLKDLSFLDLIFSGDESGRIITTATAVLSLEIYYRYGRILNVRGAPARGETSDAGASTPPPPSREGERGAAIPNESVPRPSERDVFENEKELRLDEPPVEDPILKDAKLSDHHATDVKVDYEAFKGIENLLSDRPYQGKYWNSAIGIGGGAGGAFGGRFGGRRNLRAYGGGRHTESAVLMGDIFMKKVFSAEAMPRRNSLEVALGLLAYLGSGHTHKHGKFKNTVKRLLKHLKDRQRPDGLFAGAPPGSEHLTHALATCAFSEAYGLTNKSPLLQDPAQKAVNALLGLQRESGGFGRNARARSDALATAFAVLALKSAQLGGLAMPKKTFERALKYYDSISGEAPGVVGFQDRPEASDALHLPSIAGALVARIFMTGNDAAHRPEVRGGAALLSSNLPDWSAVGRRGDMTYLYLGTLAMFQVGMGHWKAWNPALKSALLPTQVRSGPLNGTWGPRPSYLLRGIYTAVDPDLEAIRQVLDRLAEEIDVLPLRIAAGYLTTLTDPATVEALAEVFPPESLAGQLVRMRLGVLRLVRREFAEALEPIASAYEAAGRPESFLDLYVKSLVGAKRHREAVDLLSREASAGRLDDRRSGELASLLLEAEAGVEDPVTFVQELGKRLERKPFALYRGLLYGLEEAGRSEEALRMAYGLFRESGYRAECLRPVLDRLKKSHDEKALQELFLEVFGRNKATVILAVQLNREMIWRKSLAPADAIAAIAVTFPGEAKAAPRRFLLEILSRQKPKEAPAVTARALEALIGETGATRDRLKRLMNALSGAAEHGKAAGIASTFIRDGDYGQEEILVLQKAARIDETSGLDPWRVVTSFVEMAPYDPGNLKRVAQLLKADGLEHEALSLLAEAFRLDPDDADTGFMLVSALQKIGDEPASEKILFNLLETTYKKNRHAVWRRAETRLREWIRILEKRKEHDRATRLRERLRKALVVDIEVILTWDTKGTDVDLHVVEPGGAVCNYQRKTVPGGGALDVDDTDGHGPETYVIRRARRGTYEVKVVFFAGKAETRATVKIRTKVGTAEEAKEEKTVVLTRSKQTEVMSRIDMP